MLITSARPSSLASLEGERWYALIDYACTNSPALSSVEMNDTSRPLNFFGEISAVYTGTTVKRMLYFHCQCVMFIWHKRSVIESIL